MGVESLAIYNMLFFVYISVDVPESTPIRMTEVFTCSWVNGMDARVVFLIFLDTR
jgi:hypothetical protein